MFWRWRTNWAPWLTRGRAVGRLHLLHPLVELVELGEDLVEGGVVPLDGHVAEHGVAELLVEQVGVLGVLAILVLLEDALVVLLRLLLGLLEDGLGQVEGAARQVLLVARDGGAGGHATPDAREQRVGAEAVGAVVLVVDLADGVEAGDVGRVVARRARLERAALVALVVHPEAAHRVVDGGEDLHRVVVRVDADELLVDLEDAGELVAEELLVLVREVEVDLVLVLARVRVEDAAPLVEARLEERARGDVAGDEVAVAGVHPLEEVVAILLRDVPAGRACRSCPWAPRRGRPRRGRSR